MGFNPCEPFLSFLIPIAIDDMKKGFPGKLSEAVSKSGESNLNFVTDWLTWKWSAFDRNDELMKFVNNFNGKSAEKQSDVKFLYGLDNALGPVIWFGR